MVTYTTTYNLKKPTVADDEDVWGGYLNDSMDIIDDVLDGTVPVTGIDINSGTLDNVVIGGTTANTGTFTVLTANTSLGVTGNITVSGTVDGRDVAADGTKLDGIESGATADQTKADIDALGIAASTASTLATARNIALSGDVSGSASFDGSANISITATVANDSHTHDGRYYTESEADSRFVNTAGDTLTGTLNYRMLQNQTSANLDTAGDSSGFSVFYGTSSATGKPSGTDHAVATFSFSNAWQTQMAMDWRTKDMYFRTQENGTWKSWSKMWHDGNDGSGSGLDADTVDGIQASSFLRSDAADSTASTISFTGDIMVGDQIYHHGDTDTYMQFGTNQWNVYVGGSREITVDTTGVRLGDTGNGYFQPVSGNYGSIQIDGGAHGSWEGYSIGGRVVFMHDNGTGTGIYNDVDNEWLIDFSHNGDTRLRNNGTTKVTIGGTYMEMAQHIDLNNYDIYGVDQIFHHGDTNTYMQFHAADQWRVVTGGTERIEVNNSRTQIDKLLTDAALHEDYDALSGTSPTADPDLAGAFSLTMTGNTTFTFGAPGLGSGVSTGFIIEITGNGGTLLWPSSVEWAGGTAPDAPASGETDIYVFWTRDGGTTWYGVQSIDAAA